MDTSDTAAQNDGDTKHDHEIAPDAQPANDPGVASVYRYLMYGLSLPERTVRSSAAMIGGAIHESATLLVPQAFRDSKTYDTFVKQMLDMLANDVGGVAGTKSAANSTSDTTASDTTGTPTEAATEDYVARKAVGTFVDLAGMATLHVSPLTILAIVSDLAYGSQTYLKELAEELKREGIIDENSTINSTADLLDEIGQASARTADSFDKPPISVQGLRETIEQTSTQIGLIDPAKVLPQAEIAGLWNDMQQMADQEDVNLFEISSAMTMYALDRVNTVRKGALTSVRVTGQLLDRNVIDHYRLGLNQINEKGLYTMLAENSKPYIDAVWYNFSSERPTLTEDIASGKLPGKMWNGFCEWWGGTDGSQE